MGEQKEHYYQVLPDRLSKDFAAVRDATDLFADTDPDTRPTIHEVRALGSFLYKDEQDKTKVMDAMAHSDIEMTKRYQAGHAVEEIEIGIEELPLERLGGCF